MLKIQNSRLMAQLQGNSMNKEMKHDEKEMNPFSKVNYYDLNKENNFKDEMLRLPIFQKNKKNNEHTDNTPSPRTTPQGQKHPQHSQVSQASQSIKGVNINKKKAEF